MGFEGLDSFASDFMSGLGTATKDLNIGSLVPETGLAEMFGPTRANLPAMDVSGFGGMGSGGGGKPTDWNSLIKLAGGGLGLAGSLAQIPLGIAGLDVARRGQKALEKGAETAQAAAAPKIAAEQRLLPAGTDALLTGKLPPELQSQVDLQVNQAKEQMLQNLTRSGIDPATAEAMIQGQLDQLRTQLTTELGQSLLSGGSTVGDGGSVGVQGGQLGSQELQVANQSLQGANQALNRVLAGSS